MILITYTTKYRKGGDKFTRIAQTLELEKKADGHSNVLCLAIESKRDLKAAFAQVSGTGNQIEEFHFVGHSGMYGPMFGTVEYPEQFSPWEWEQLSIPFATTAKAYFNCCRSARWFAPFFARVKNVTTYGYHWYTTFSASKTRFKKSYKESDPLYSIGCKGRKSHGLIGSLKKYAGLQEAEPYKEYQPESPTGDNTYNQVAELYDAVFQDIKVREDEWQWLNTHWPKGENIRMLDIGCGNGALLNELSDRISKGTGVDLSTEILERARKFNANNTHISFEAISGPQLPFEDSCFEVVTSLLSFRYLDWDPLMEEIKRILVPGGKFLVIDMVTAPVKVSSYSKLLYSKIKHYKHRKKYPDYYANLQKLVTHPDWQTMLQYNPIRSEHEMTWYLESRFPGQKVEIINIGWNARILAFDTGDFQRGKQLKLTYP